MRHAILGYDLTQTSTTSFCLDSIRAYSFRSQVTAIGKEDDWMRVTMQCGRQGSATHNMHSHVDRNSRDVMLCDYTRMAGDTLRAREIAYYNATFGQALNARNERYRKQRHPERCRTMEQVYTGRTTRPEEVILQVGRLGDTIDRETFKALVMDFMTKWNAWNDKMGHPAQTLNVSLHYDETTPHAHWRRVWQYRDAQSNMQIGQAQALQRAGVQMPTPAGQETRYNNRKMTYDAQVRRLWQSVCKSHGLDIETEPLPSHRHKSTEDYIDSCIANKVAQVTDLNTRIDAQTHNLQNLQDTAAQARREAFEATETLRHAEATLENKQRVLNKVEHILDGAEQVAAVVAPGIRGDIQRVRRQAMDARDEIRHLER